MTNQENPVAPSPLGDTTNQLPVVVDRRPVAIEPTSQTPPVPARRAAGMRGRVWLTVLVLVALVGAVGGWMASRTMESPREVQARTQPPPATIITAVVQSTKITSTVVSRGEVGAVDSVQVGYGSLIPPDDSGDTDDSGSDSTTQVSGVSGGDAGGGSGVLTGVFVKRGSKVHQGQAVVEVDGRPVIVLQGARAAYRDMKPGMSGVDITQLQHSLASLGYYAGSFTGVFDQATQAAVDRLYKAAGYSSPTTDNGDGTDQQTIQADQDAVDDANSALNVAESQRTTAMRQWAKQYVAWEKAHKKDPKTAGVKPVYAGPTGSDIHSDQRSLAAAERTLHLDESDRGTMVPMDEVVFVPRLPATVTQIGTGFGYGVGSPLFTLTPDALVLTAQVATSQAGFLQVGSGAQVSLPGGVVAGKVTSIGDSTTPGQATVTISTPRPLPVALEGDDVKVTFVAASTPGKVLAVPQGAINSDAAGNLSVIVQAANGSLTRVPVTVGVTGSDLVEVKPSSPSALSAGDKVVIGG